MTATLLRFVIFVREGCCCYCCYCCYWSLAIGNTVSPLMLRLEKTSDTSLLPGLENPYLHHCYRDFRNPYLNHCYRDVRNPYLHNCYRDFRYPYLQKCYRDVRNPLSPLS